MCNCFSDDKETFDDLTALAVSRVWQVASTPDPALLVARRDPVHKKKIIIKNYFFDFKHKKETIRKEINSSRLAIKNFHDITGKHRMFF